MKKVIFIISIFMLITNVHAQFIDRLTFKDEGRLLHDYDYYDGSINRYENRLITQNALSIQEFKIHPDGTLERIKFYENRNGNHFGIIDNDRFYNMGTNSGRYVYVEIFDLLQAPMRKIAGITAHEIGGIIPSFFLSEYHIMITDMREARTTLINRKTFEIDGYIDGLYSSLISTSGSMLFIPEFVNTPSGRTTIVNVSEMEYIEDEYLFTEITSITLYNTDARRFSFQDNYMFAMTSEGCVILDITDIHNPIIMYDIPNINFVYAAILTDDRIYLSLANGDLVVYNRDGQGEITRLFEDRGGWSTRYNNMYLHGQFLYKNKGHGLKVYDVNNGFDEVFFHGQFDGSQRFISRKNDIYYIEFDRKHWIENNHQTQKHNVYSLIENRFLASFETESFIALMGVHIIGDYKYILYTVTEGTFIGIYRMNEMDYEYLNTVFISPEQSHRPFIHEDLVYISYWDPDRVMVYRMIGQDVEHITNFNGQITYPIQPQSTDVILNWQAETLHFRDINNPSNILFTSTLREAASLFAIDKYTFIVNNYRFIDEFSWIDIYEFCLNGQSIFYLGRHHGLYEPINYGVILNYSFLTGNSKFYSIINGRLVQIGELEGERFLRATYFFKEQRKLLQIAASGVWVYSVDFNSIVSEDDEVAPVAQTGLLGNFPNPYNPSTTIDFSLSFGEGRGEGSNINITIYNIRGQRVKTLVNDHLPAGRHSVVWNGTDDNGRTVGSGVYLYRMTAGEYSETRRMLLMK